MDSYQSEESSHGLTAIPIATELVPLEDQASTTESSNEPFYTIVARLLHQAVPSESLNEINECIRDYFSDHSIKDQVDLFCLREKDFPAINMQGNWKLWKLLPFRHAMLTVIEASDTWVLASDTPFHMLVKESQDLLPSLKSITTKTTTSIPKNYSSGRTNSSEYYTEVASKMKHRAKDRRHKNRIDSSVHSRTFNLLDGSIHDGKSFNLLNGSIHRKTYNLDDDDEEDRSTHRKTYPFLDTSIHGKAFKILDEVENNSKQSTASSSVNSSSGQNPSIDSKNDSTILVKETFEELKSVWNIDTDITSYLEFVEKKKSTTFTQVKIDNISDAVLLSESWNKILAFRYKFAEGLGIRWRVLVAEEVIKRHSNEAQNAAFGNQFWMKDVYSNSTNMLNNQDEVEHLVMRMIENNNDPIAKVLGSSTVNIGLLLVSMIDSAIRSLCPHAQVVQRETYHPIKGSADMDNAIADLFYHKDECQSFADFCSKLGSYHIKPKHWLLFCDAFLWTMKTHNPYSLGDEKDDLNIPDNKGAHARFIAGMVILPLIQVSQRRYLYLKHPIFVKLRRHLTYDLLGSGFEMVTFNAFENLFDSHPDAKDHLSENDCDEIMFYLFEL